MPEQEVEQAHPSLELRHQAAHEVGARLVGGAYAQEEVEQGLLDPAFFVHLPQQGGAHVFPDPGRRGHHRGTDLGHVGHHDLADRLGVRHGAGVVELDVLDHALEGVPHRQHRQERVAVVDGDDLGHGGPQVVQVVAVGEHHALGLARRARGVDQGGQVFRGALRDFLAVRLGVLREHLRAAVHHLGEGHQLQPLQRFLESLRVEGFVHHDDRLQEGQFLLLREDLRELHARPRRGRSRRPRAGGCAASRRAWCRSRGARRRPRCRGGPGRR